MPVWGGRLTWFWFGLKAMDELSHLRDGLVNLTAPKLPFTQRPLDPFPCQPSWHVAPELGRAARPRPFPRVSGCECPLMSSLPPLMPPARAHSPLQTQWACPVWWECACCPGTPAGAALPAPQGPPGSLGPSSGSWEALFGAPCRCMEPAQGPPTLHLPAMGSLRTHCLHSDDRSCPVSVSQTRRPRARREGCACTRVCTRVCMPVCLCLY